MKKVISIITLIILSNYTVWSQKHELGNVTIDELKEKINAKDTSAVATILFEKGKTYFDYKQNEGFFVMTEVEMKIKIYKKGGYEWANTEVPFYIGSSNRESVSFSKAVTYNLVNNQIEKTKLKSENEFSEQKNKFLGLRKITMPNVKEGSIIEYKYTIKSPYISNFPDWKFQRSVPVNYSEYITDIPEYYFYNVHRKGVLTPIEAKDKFSKTLQLDELVAPHGRGGGYVHDLENINYIDNRTTYTLENIPALKEESFINNIENYASSLEFEHSGTQMHQKAFESFSTTWGDVAKKIYESDSFGSQIDKNNYFEADLKTLLQGLTSNEEKVATIFSYVQSRMTWNKYNSYSCDGGVKKAYQDKTGNSAEINLMLVSMLRFAGLDANPVLVSTRANGVALYPSRIAYNTVIASVMIDGKLSLLDATSKYALPNILPLRDLNWFGRIIRKDETSDLIDLMPSFSSQDVVNMLATIDAKGLISGKVREQYLDYNGLRFRENYSGVSKESIMEKMEKRNSGLEVSDYDLNDKDLGEPVVEKYAFKDSNEADIIGDKLYFSPLLQFATKENPFKQETREFPVDFSFPSKDKYMLNITIPDGYQVESLPKPVALAMDKGYGNFSLAISNTDNQIQATIILNINTSIVPAEDYDTLKEFFKKVIEKENEKIVLKKI